MAAGSAGETGEPASSIARRAKLEPICATGTSAPIARIPMRAAIAWTVLARCQAATAKQIENHGVICCQRSEEHTSELQSLMRNSYAVFCLKKKKKQEQK